MTLSSQQILKSHTKLSWVSAVKATACRKRDIQNKRRQRNEFVIYSMEWDTNSLTEFVTFYLFKRSFCCYLPIRFSATYRVFFIILSYFRAYRHQFWNIKQPPAIDFFFFLIMSHIYFVWQTASNKIYITYNSSALYFTIVCS